MTRGRVAITTRMTTKTIIKPRTPVRGQARLGEGLQVSAQLSLIKKARRYEHGYSFYHLQFVVVVVVATTSCQNSKLNTLSTNGSSSDHIIQRGTWHTVHGLSTSESNSSWVQSSQARARGKVRGSSSSNCLSIRLGCCKH